MPNTNICIYKFQKIRDKNSSSDKFYTEEWW